MKKMILSTLSLAITAMTFSACSSEVKEPKFVIGETPAGIEITAPKYEWNSYDGQYLVNATVKNKGKESFKYLQLNAVFKDGSGNTTAEALTGPGYVFEPGNEDNLKINWLFPTEEDLPEVIELNITN